MIHVVGLGTIKPLNERGYVCRTMDEEREKGEDERSRSAQLL
jgi:hypothetical protein